ncbi:amidohydrolase family protein [Leucobacter viscericola]|uniref:Amidohydrolase family protein n=1 Tax=Leucobacter viscericola TaxID=2714935 RepID=A0A6G7XHK4_9MICO|nr:amidohydrolase family protein [Leucobacter viscericola]QIK63929.1 amidohydrolase family protein [Leucobacter viscericola]
MLAARSIRVMGDDGSFSAPTRVSWANGRFELGGDPEATDLDGSRLWMIPGFVDTHLHAAWQQFDAADRANADPEATQQAIAEGLRRTLEAGVTTVRDAGGLTEEMLRGIPERSRPRAQLAVTLIDREAASAAGGVAAATSQALEAGARWIKLVATAGVAAPAGAGLDPVYSAAEQSDAVRLAEQAGAGVMVHAWGGQAIDDAIEAGAMSIEHGIYLTDAQAKRAANRGMTLVPTLRIYRLVQRMISSGALPSAFRARVDEAVVTHPRAVLRARDAGLPVALGTDYGTAEQHGSNRREFDALVEAGLTPGEALVAATRAGAALLSRVAVDLTVVSDGRIAEGSIADAVILRNDPNIPGVLSAPEAVFAVVRGGHFFTPVLTTTREDHP